MDDSSEPATLREKAYASFTRHLLARDLRPGQFVSQRELVAFTGLTLGAIREIVPRLEAEGLLTTIPQRGMQIAHIDISLIREAFQFRLFMEREAVALFTTTASDAELARLRREHEDMLARALAQTPTTEVEAEAQNIDWAMHDSFIDALGNEIIAKAYLVNSVKIRLIHQERFRIDGRVVPVMREHLTVIEALESRDPQKAVEAISLHIDNARRLALQI
ncbi:GntR family transcriptional regulator [Mesorhizobium sp. AR10]|uniref:GntR family transcriptional regulator n=1 Tax=Mesorhizobium sp. AR10 TaxID=2865839 RepID=UPI0021602C43|nr:GntR family transcriptional regulator [Mesorhizobium sp. AR10]UVK37096.1 GntR family transcriptional regulator [Mesorhizobium sp. AR10]